MSDETEDAKIIREAKDRFERCEDWESECRRHFVEDLKFANGDPDNGWQWDQKIYDGRIEANKPCLTINKTRQHNLIITNDAKQNKPGVNIRPVGDGASYDAAQVYEGVVRHIEYQSNAEQAYDTASVFQVQGGWGYWRVVTDYVSDESFDQDIFICRVPNPLSVYLDPDITEVNGSDARFGFVFEDISRKVFEAEYPDLDEAVSDRLPFGNGSNSTWGSKDTVRVCEYYRMENKSDTLVAMVIPDGYEGAGTQIIVRKSKMTDDQKAVYELVKGTEDVQERKIVTDEIMWYKIVGDKIVDRRPWLGKYIPLVRIIGEETIIDGKLDRKGHTRAMKDAQRMLNYWNSEATAQVALQTKSPYIGAAEAIEGYEEDWRNANVSNKAILAYNAFGDGGEKIDPPKRSDPPVMAQAYVTGMQLCENQLMMTSGQYQSQFGQNENATSGKAINERQRQGDTATYHFIDGLAIGIRYTGMILIDLIPKIYDTPRVVRILAKDGTESQVQVDPNSEIAYQSAGSTPSGEQMDDVTRIAQAIFNPNVGRYEVESDVGPGYATRRQEAFNAMTQIAAQNPQFMNVAGDLLWKSADFPLSDELAERWARIIPKNITGEAPAPEVQQMQQQMQMLQDAVVNLQKQLEDKSDETEIKAYDAETKRITAIGNSGPAIDPETLRPVLMQLIAEMMAGELPDNEEGREGGQGGAPPMMPPMQGAA